MLEVWDFSNVVHWCDFGNCFLYMFFMHIMYIYKYNFAF